MKCSIRTQKSIDNNSEFFVNEEKRTVVCKVSECENLLNADMANNGFAPHKALAINESYIGIARCFSTDVFNEGKGIEIAKKHASAAIVAAKRRALKAFVKENVECVNILTESADKLIGKYDNIIQHGKNYIKKITEDSSIEDK